MPKRWLTAALITISARPADARASNGWPAVWASRSSRSIPSMASNNRARVAVIDEAMCIGCTLCIQACPVDAIVGAAKQMHTVVPDLCTGCDLCVAPCPVDCIAMVEVTPGRTGWDAWSQEQADAARERHDFRQQRLLREKRGKRRPAGRQGRRQTARNVNAEAVARPKNKPSRRARKPSSRPPSNAPACKKKQRKKTNQDQAYTKTRTKTKQTAMNAEKRRAIFSRLRTANPHPTTELEYTSPFELLIAVHAVGAGHRRLGQQGHAQAVPGAPTRRPRSTRSASTD